MKKLSLVVTLAGLIFGCGGDKGTDSPFIENFTGTYVVRDVTVAMQMKRDSVTFTITDGLTYSMRFRKVSDIDDLDFCGCDGRLERYTGNLFTFVPLVNIGSNCDTLRIPRGDFNADYQTHSPEIYIEKTIGDSLFQMVVIRQ
ncbi:MAG: hypothetical protein JSU74_10465 [Candidatus Zixiibacteriota bacterium]|nr:MAG: hypothetical protein JSU74_10465 [candidate division Zixibacteria bacterium]